MGVGHLSVMLLSVLLVLWGCDGDSGRIEGPPVPQELLQGEVKFNANCASCHGPRATGTNQGPPLVHKVYEPNHHADAAFHRAAANGVRAHHWQFGDMPKIQTVTLDDVDQIIQYVRWLQRQAGIQ